MEKKEQENKEDVGRCVGEKWEIVERIKKMEGWGKPSVLKRKRERKKEDEVMDMVERDIQQ